MARAACMWFSSMTRKPDRRTAEPAGAAAPSPDDADIWRRLSETVKPLAGKTRKPQAKPKPRPAAPNPTIASRPAPMAPIAPMTTTPKPMDLPLGHRRAIAGLTGARPTGCAAASSPSTPGSTCMA